MRVAAISRALIIPIAVNRPHQRQVTELDGIRYIFDLDWIERLQRWTFDLRTSGGEELLLCKGLVGGSDLLRQKKYDSRVPQGSLVIIDRNGLNTDPTLETLGGRHILVYLPVGALTITEVDDSVPQQGGVFLITESGDSVITESSDNVITE